MNQPPRGAASKKMEPARKTPPMKKAQKPNAERRGNGRSRAPSICGSSSTAMASNTGIANRNIITEPCTVDRKSTRLNSSHLVISYSVFCLKKKNRNLTHYITLELKHNQDT